MINFMDKFTHYNHKQRNTMCWIILFFFGLLKLNWSAVTGSGLQLNLKAVISKTSFSLANSATKLSRTCKR